MPGLRTTAACLATLACALALRAGDPAPATDAPSAVAQASLPAASESASTAATPPIPSAQPTQPPPQAAPGAAPSPTASAQPTGPAASTTSIQSTSSTPPPTAAPDTALPPATAASAPKPETQNPKPTAPAAGADTAALIDGILDNGRAWLEENFETEELEPLTPEQIHQLAARLQPVADALAIGSIEDFAALRPQAAALLAWLRTQEWGTPYADWLAPRMDYLDLAAEAVETSRRQWEIEQQRLRTQPPPDLSRPPAERPRPTLRFEIVRDRVYRSALSNNSWKRRIAERTPPPRAAELAPQLKEIFRAEGVSPEWIWLAEVESSFDPEAQSPSGARGLFQFMPATAKRFGLRTFPFDERTDPAKSARAAAQYLRYLHIRFGDWPLALAAYNAGEGRISRALDKAKRRSFDEIADRLPAETRFYVPKVLATVAARENVDPFALPAPTRLTSSTAAPALVAGR